MRILAYLLIPILVVTVVASVSWLRNRQPTSLQSGINSFRREMDALSPDAGPVNRRPQSHTPSARPSPRPPRAPDAPD